MISKRSTTRDIPTPTAGEWCACPNISPIEEMANLVNASKSYEANLAAMNIAKQLAIKALEIGK